MYLGDMDYYDVPIKKLLDFQYNQQRADKINLQKATPSNEIACGNIDVEES